VPTGIDIDQMSLTNTSYSLVPSIARQDRSLANRLVSAVLSQWPQRTRGSPPLGNYMRRDVGLPPLDHGRRYWDHQ
jgi:hypothetical protein